MQTYQARDLARMSDDELWSIPRGPVRVIFDDGEVISDDCDTIFSATLWQFYHQYPKTPALMHHHVNGRPTTTDLASDIINAVRWDCFDAYDKQLDNEVLSEQVVEGINRCYNTMTYRLEAYATTLGMADIIEVLDHPEIRAANAQVNSSDKSIAHAHRTIERVLKDPKELPDNILARSVQSGLVKLGQVVQCVGPRGSVTDIDSNIFRYPTLTGFAEGLYRFYDSFIESRTAAKSLTFTEKPLQDTEYFNRRLQLLAGTLTDVYEGDCGSTEYMLWQMAAGDLPAFAGKYYLKDDGTLGTIYDNTECRKELVGRTVRVRSVFDCLTKDSSGVCATCYGEQFYSVPAATAIGHVAATSLCKQASQQVLSVKHLDTSASSTGMRLSDYELRYVRIGTDANLMFLAQRLEGKKITLTIRQDEAERLSEVKSAESVEILLPTHISSLTQVGFTVVDPKNGKEERDLVQVSNGSRTSSLSREMLIYLREKGWNLTEAGDIEIDLSAWDFDMPVFTTPRRQENMLDYMATIEKFLKAIKRGGAVKSLKDYDTPADALRGFYELVSSRLFVNIVHQEILVKVCMVRSSRNRDFRIPLAGNRTEFSKFDQSIFNRSMGAAMAFQYHKQQWNNPATYLVFKRPPHILDPVLMPRPMLELSMQVSAK